MAQSQNNFPKLHNAAWPGVVGKGEGSEPPIGLDTMLVLSGNTLPGDAEMRINSTGIVPTYICSTAVI